MKRTLKMFALALALVLPMSRAAFAEEAAGDDFRTRLTHGQELMQACKNFHMDMHMDIDMSMVIQGQHIDTEAVVDSSADVEQKPMKLCMDMQMDISAMGQRQKQSARTYVVQDGDRMLAYVSLDGGRSWQKQDVGTMPDVLKQTEAQMAMWLECADSFRATGTRMVNGAPALEYQGELSGDSVRKSLELSGAMDSMKPLLGNLQSTELFRGLAPIAVTVAFDEAAGTMVYFETDMGNSMDTLMTRLSGEVARSQSLPPAAFSMSVSTANFVSTFSRFGEVSVVLPDGIGD